MVQNWLDFILRRNRYVYGHNRAIYRRTESTKSLLVRRLRLAVVPVAFIVGAAILAAGVFTLILRGPWWFDGDHIDETQLRSGSAALVTGLRAALIQIIAAFGAGIALFYTARNYRLTRRGQVTDRFTKSLERLGSDEMYIRLGGILALDQILHDAPDQGEHATQVLAAFVRNRCAPAAPLASGRGRISRARRAAVRSGAPSASKLSGLLERPEEDVQAALVVLTRPDLRRRTRQKLHLDFSGLHLSGADFTNSDLSQVDFGDACLVGANFRQANLTEASFERADLSKADLSHCVCVYARFTEVRFEDAWLSHANFTRAWLERSDFSGGYLNGSKFKYARMEGVRLEAADARECDFVDADLRNADFGTAKIGEAKLDWASLGGADLGSTVGLTVEQACMALIADDTSLPWEIAINEEVRNRMGGSPAPRWDM
ncbi:pentapeptide repeat-containing protein [Streptomyces sp. NPDC059949]|uniref:pentapeptide repeat-containing protein n=1 Tax=Streptomyces sp. NPDC059949 TaxID=3347013 RepID=UPI003654BBEB